jgi:4-carboxymuconolactone decarboxylase
MSERSKTYEDGLATRKKVLGDEHVTRSMSSVDEFTAPLQDFLIEHAWGAVWTREGLSLQERSMINLAMLTALNRPHELKLHLKGALNNGLTQEQIREILLQTAVYCGAPAAIDAFRAAKQVFAEMQQPSDG